MTYKIIVTSRYVVEMKNAVIAMAKRCTLFRDALTEHEKPEYVEMIIDFSLDDILAIKEYTSSQ